LGATLICLQLNAIRHLVTTQGGILTALRISLRTISCPRDFSLDFVNDALKSKIATNNRNSQTPLAISDRRRTNDRARSNLGC
jgi:hypothetical protein